MILLVMMLVLCSVGYAVVDTTTTFAGKSSKFNFTINTYQNATYYIGVTNKGYISNGVHILLKSSPNMTLLYNDSFNRADNAVVGNGWVESSNPGGLYIQNNRLVFEQDAALATTIYNTTPEYYLYDAGYISFVINCTNTNSANRLHFFLSDNTLDDMMKIGFCKSNDFWYDGGSGWTQMNFGMVNNVPYKVEIVMYNKSTDGSHPRNYFVFIDGNYVLKFGINKLADVRYYQFTASNAVAPFVANIFNFTIANMSKVTQINYNLTSTIAGNRFNISWPINKSYTNLTFINISSYVKGNCNCTGCQLNSSICYIPITFHNPIYVNATYEASLIQDINSSYGIDNCTNSYNIPSNATALNVSFYDSTDTLYQTLFEFYSNYGPTTTYTSNYSYGNDYTNFSICIYPNWANFYTDALITYNGTSYNTYQLNLTNNTQQLSLYTQSGTTEVTFTVTDYSDIEIENAYIHVLKWDVAENSYNTVEVLKTDQNGEAVGHIILGAAYYKFIIQYAGETVLIDPATQGVILYTTSRTFRVNIGDAGYLDDFDIYFGAETSLAFNNNTSTFTYTWTDPTSAMHYGCLKVSETNQSKTKVLYDGCTESTSATIVFTITPNNGSRYVATGYFKFDNIFITDTYEVGYSVGYELYKIGQPSFSLFMAFLVVLAMLLVGLPYPELSAILGSVGLIVTFALGLWNVSIGLVVSLIVVSMFYLYKVRRA